MKKFTVCGGISRKNPFIMQLYADILGMNVEVIETQVGPALGSAIFAAAAAGRKAGGYPSVQKAAQAMKSPVLTVCEPVPEHVAAYNELYREYRTLYAYFGEGENNVMERLHRFMKE